MSISRRPWTASLVFLSVWTVAVTIALVVTLHSLDTDSFDGLNNLVQLPFALPWFLLPLPALFDWSHTADAWAAAAMGWVNGLIIAGWLGLRSARRA